MRRRWLSSDTQRMWLRLALGAALLGSVANCRQVLGLDDVKLAADAPAAADAAVDAAPSDAACWTAPNVGNPCDFVSTDDIVIPPATSGTVTFSGATGKFVSSSGTELAQVRCMTVLQASNNLLRVCVMKSLDMSHKSLSISNEDGAVAFVVHGDATVNNVSLANIGPDVATKNMCMSTRGTDSVASPAGGAGGSGIARGGNGGAGASTPIAAGGVAGPANLAPSLVPIITGCRGGSGGRVTGGDFGGNAGTSGGAFELAAAGTITVEGFIDAAGRGGNAGAKSATGTGGAGGGGGSGGAVLLHGARVVVLGTAKISANGGGGGAGGGGTSGATNNSANLMAAKGGVGALLAGSGGDGGFGNAATATGIDGNVAGAADRGAGGGGGGTGRIVLTAREPGGLVITQGAVIVPAPN